MGKIVKRPKKQKLYRRQRKKTINGKQHLHHGYRTKKEDAKVFAEQLKKSYSSVHVRKGRGVNSNKYELWVS